MKKLLILAFLLFIVKIVMAQTYKVKYEYDNSGNRIKRYITEITLKSAHSADDEEPILDSWEEREVTIYPNPTKGNLKINISGGDEDANYTYKIFDSRGNQVLNGKITDLGETPIPLDNQSPGVYILILQTNNERKSYKIVKQ